jgi:hypothetical protein
MNMDKAGSDSEIGHQRHPHCAARLGVCVNEARVGGQAAHVGPAPMLFVGEVVDAGVQAQVFAIDPASMKLNQAA